MDLVTGLKIVLEKIDLAFDYKNEPEEIFLSYVDSYLLALEDWQRVNAQLVSNENVKSIPGFTDLVGDLKSKHHALMEITLKSRDDVGEELAGINNRARAIRRYIDVLPARVSVTRGKKG